MDEWKNKIKRNLNRFYSELDDVCRQFGRIPESIDVLFATKYLSGEQLGLFIDQYFQIRGEKVLIGENRVQQASEKFGYLSKTRPDLNEKFIKAMIGNLQTNKINKALTLFDEIWGVDNQELAEAIDKRADRVIPIFMEVNVSGEKSKHGTSPEKLDETIGLLKSLKSLRLKGLMTMAPETEDRNLIRQVFRELKKIASKHNLLASIGMSNDWKEAVEEGSDILRIGSIIFKD